MNTAFSRRLFVAAATALVSPLLAQPTLPADAVRSRELAVDAGALALIAAAQGRTTIHLFDDLDLPLIIENTWRTADGVACSGRIDGDSRGAFSLAVNGGQLSATATINGRHVGLTPTGRADGAGHAICTAQELAPGTVIRCAMTGPIHGQPHPTPTVSPVGNSTGSSFGAPPPTGACDCHDDQGTVDLLVVYSSAALTNAGGLPALTARINDAVASANQAFIASGVTTGPGGAAVNRLAVRVVGIQSIAYNEQPYPADWTQHLSRLSTPNDGYMDDVHAMRDAAKADLVMLVVDDPNFTGGAAWYAVYSDAYAFSTLNWRGMGGGNLTLAHELGHNFGCAHDRGNSDWSPFRYAWGYWFTAGSPPHTYGDIMSYTGDGLPFYSNPLINDPGTGHAMGAPLADPLATDNALTIAQTRWTLASYRDGTGIVDCNGNGIDDSIDIANGTSQDANGNCRPDECEYRVYVDASNTGPVDGLSWNTAWPSLADALAFASMKCSNVSEVWVAGGIYKPDQGGETDQVGSRYATFRLRGGLSVVGGFHGKNRPGGGETAVNQRVLGAHPTILSGDIGVQGVDTDNSFNVVTVEMTGGNAVLDGVTIEHGYQDGDGGGMYASDSSVTVRNCTFRNNRGGGGAGFTAAGALASPTLTNCTFFSNTAVGSGASVGSRSSASVTLDGCAVHDCTATYGAVAASFDSSLTVRNCTIENNTATSNSGAIDCYGGCTLTVENSTLRNNHGQAAGAGAAVIHTNCNAAFTNCSITGNTCAGAGGAVWVDHSTAAFTGCTIENNTAADGGGGLAVYNASNVTVDSSTLRNNTARWGGGVTSNDSTLTLRRTLLETNHAAQYSGGAIDLYNNQTTLVNAALRANTAAEGGAGISLGQNSTLTATNCTVYANSAVNTGGGIGMYQATLTLNNSILYANTATNTPGVLDKQLTVFSGTRTVNRSCVQGLSGQLGGSGNVGGDPLLADPSAGDLTLGPGSPCIDAGSNTLVPVGTTLDLAGNPRFADDPSVADTGVGPVPVVDMGAFERVGPPPCPADLGVQGGLPGHDGRLDNNDFIAFISFFFTSDSRADLGVQGGLPGHDGHFDNNDFISFINLFFSGCS